MANLSRVDLLALLSGEPLARLPVFSGLPSLTAPGLHAVGLRYPETHTDANLMARAAASTFELFGFESVVVPFDLCVEAEALGCQIDFQTEIEGFLPPVVDQPLNWSAPLNWPDEVTQAGRIPLVGAALEQLRRTLGPAVCLGAWVPGPFTLAWQLYGAEAWLTGLHAETTAPLLLRLAEFLGRVGNYYRAAGADFITVHEMGGSAQVVGPHLFRAVVKPPLRHLIERLPAPRVLSVCGDTNAIVLDLAECGAEALNVDHRNDLARTRRLLGPRAILLGNFDPVGVLSQGTPDLIRATVQAIRAAGANAIWPGCDLWPEIPEGNFRALMRMENEA